MLYELIAIVSMQLSFPCSYCAEANQFQVRPGNLTEVKEYVHLPLNPEFNQLPTIDSPLSPHDRVVQLPDQRKKH